MYQRNQWHLGTFLYTTGLNVKMSLLLGLPAIGVLSLQALASREAITQAMILVQVSVSTISLSPSFLLQYRFQYK